MPYKKSFIFLVFHILLLIFYSWKLWDTIQEEKEESEID